MTGLQKEIEPVETIQSGDGLKMPADPRKNLTRRGRNYPEKLKMSPVKSNGVEN